MNTFTKKTEKLKHKEDKEKDGKKFITGYKKKGLDGSSRSQKKYWKTTFA